MFTSAIEEEIRKKSLPQSHNRKLSCRGHLQRQKKADPRKCRVIKKVANEGMGCARSLHVSVRAEEKGKPKSG